MNVLAVGAHWDDIELGCCLTLGGLRERGAKLYGAVLTDSETHVVGVGHVRSAEVAAKEGKAVFAAMNVEALLVRQDTTGELRYTTKLMQQLERTASARAIDIVFTHWPGDVNTDHRAAWELSRVAFRSIPGLLCYRSNGWCDGVSRFEPDLFCDFSEQEYRRKTELLKQHATEWPYRERRWQREIFDQERLWGFRCGRDYAEAFQVCRLLWGKL